MTRAPELKGFLAALKDERVARALAALYRKPGERWRVDTLAREAGISRTVFAERFAALLGRTPMQYLAAWRMHLADEMLRVRRSSVAQACRSGRASSPRQVGVVDSGVDFVEQEHQQPSSTTATQRAWTDWLLVLGVLRVAGRAQELRQQALEHGAHRSEGTVSPSSKISGSRSPRRPMPWASTT